MSYPPGPAPHPPLDFRPVALDLRVDYRWVAFFEGQPGTAVWSVWLSHLLADGLLVVRTAPRKRWDELMGDGYDGASLTETGTVAFHARGVHALMDMARPELPEGERDRYNWQLPVASRSLAQGWRDWEKIHCRLDGRIVQAGLFRFAHGWTGVTLIDGDRYIGVTGFNVADPAVALSEADLRLYRFSFDQPFSLRDLDAAASRHPDVEHITRSPTVHPDHGRLLGAHKPNTP